MNMTTLAVSKKVYADISTRIGAALSFAPDSAAEAMRLDWGDEYIVVAAGSC